MVFIKKKVRISLIILIVIALNSSHISRVHAASQTITFTESTNRTQTQTIKIPNLLKVTSVSVNTGAISVAKIDNETVTLSITGGVESRRVQTGGSEADTMEVKAQTSQYYNSGGYTGTLTRYLYRKDLVTTSRTENVTKYHTIVQEETANPTCPLTPCVPSWPYDDGEYSGILSKQSQTLYTTGVSAVPSWGDPLKKYKAYTWKLVFSGEVTKTVMVEEYRYRGSVSKPDTRTYQNYYQYAVTINYTTNTAPTTPGDFTPIPLYNKGGTTLDVSWAKSTDTEGDPVRYSLEFYDGVSWSTLTSGSATNAYTHKLPTLNTKTAKYRVRAFDDHKYSIYKTSGDFVIDSVPPSGTLSLNTVVKTNESVIITATATDATSGIKAIRLPNKELVNNARATYTVDKNGTYEFIFEDNAGHESVKEIVVKNISGIVQREVKTNIYIQESRMGNSYYINTNAHNYDSPTIPLPKNVITVD